MQADRRTFRLGLCVILSCVILGACGISVNVEPNEIALPDDVFPVNSNNSTGNGIFSPNMTSHPVFFIDNGQLTEASRELPAPVFLEGPLNNLLAGPSDTEVAQGLESAIPVGTVLVDVQLLRDNTIALHLNDVFYAVQGEQRIRATAQLVFTASALAQNTQGVLFYLDGRTQFLPDGAGTIAQAGEGEQPRALRVEDFDEHVTGSVAETEPESPQADNSTE